MDNHLHDEPDNGPVSQEEYDYALNQLRDFQQALARKQAKGAAKPLTLESIEIDWAVARDKPGCNLAPEQIDWLIHRVHELEKKSFTPHHRIAAAIRKGKLTGLGWSLEVRLRDWLNATQREHDEIAEAIERFDERGHSPFNWELYLANGEE